MCIHCIPKCLWNSILKIPVKFKRTFPSPTNQEREEELRLLRSQPISDNAWLKRSYSDSSLAKVSFLLPL